MTEAVEALGAELPPDARMFAPTEGTGVVVEQRRIHPYHAGDKLIDGPRAFVEIRGVDGSAETVFRIVGAHDGLVKARDAADRRRRAEALAVHDVHVRGDLGQHRGFDEPALVETGRPAAAAGYLGALIDGPRQNAFVTRTPGFCHHGA